MVPSHIIFLFSKEVMLPYYNFLALCCFGTSLEGAHNIFSSNPLPLGVGATGTVFRLHFLGSVEVDEEGGRKRRKRLKKNMVEVAVTKIKVCL